jgi:hypothetical protein
VGISRGEGDLFPGGGVLACGLAMAESDFGGFEIR